MALLATPGGQGADPLILQDIPIPGTRTARIGDYEILGVIAHGGMGVVYRARQRSLNRIVALKLLLGGAHADAAYKRRFRQEAELAARLQHPNIVPIFEVGEHEGQPYFSMEFVDGPDLARLTRERSLTPPQAAEYVAAVAIALEYAHRQGVIHRDIKPSNILIGPDDRPRISDFGLARRVTDESILTHSGATLGTPGYLPPEQASMKRGQVGPHSDVYALGALLYHLLTGRPPFMSGTAADTLQQVLEMEPAPPRTLNRDIPRDLETICLKCLQKNPSARYPSAREVAADLRRWLNNVPIEARPAGWLAAPIKWCQRRPAIAALSAALVLTICLATAGFVWQWHWMELLFAKTLPSAPPAAVASLPNRTSNPRMARAPASTESRNLELPEPRVQTDSSTLQSGSVSTPPDNAGAPARSPLLTEAERTALGTSASGNSAVGVGSGTSPGGLQFGYALPTGRSSKTGQGLFADYLQSAENDATNAAKRQAQGSPLWQNSVLLAQIHLSVMTTLMDRISGLPHTGRGLRGRRNSSASSQASPKGEDGLTNQNSADFQTLREESDQMSNDLIPWMNQLAPGSQTFLRNAVTEIGRSSTPANDAEIPLLTIELFDSVGVDFASGLAAEPTPQDEFSTPNGAKLNPYDYFDERGNFRLVDLQTTYSDFKGCKLKSESLTYDYFQKVAPGKFIMTPTKSPGYFWVFAIEQSNSGKLADEYVATFKLVNSGRPKDASFAVIAWEGPEGRIETDEQQITLSFPKSGKYEVKAYGVTTTYQSDFVVTETASF
jgi:serine/threonine protein kinase